MSTTKNIPMTPWERLDAELAKRRIAWLTLAVFLGLSKQNIGHWKTRGIPAKYLRQVAEFIGRPLEWLEFGDSGKPATTNSNVVDLIGTKKVKTEPKEPTPSNASAGNVSAARAFSGEVPVISWVQAGAWQDIAEGFQYEDAERHLPISRGHSSATYALKVRGDSMTAPYGKTYPAGCYVIIDPEKKSPSNGDRIIAITPGSKEATFKIYKDEDGRRWLAPLNTTHQIINEPFEVLGTVIGKWEDE